MTADATVPDALRLPPRRGAPAAPRRRRRRCVAVVLLGVGQAAPLIAFLLLVRAVAESVAGPTRGGATAAAWHLTLIQLGVLIAVVVVHGCLRAWEFAIVEKTGYDVVQRLRLQMYAHLQGMTARQVQFRARGGLILRLVGDLSMLR